MEAYATIAIPFFAFLLDVLIGDPRSNYHPVVLIGKVISFYENIFYYEGDGNKKKFLFGMLTVLAVLLTTGVVAALLIMAANSIHFWCGFAMKVFLLYATITPRSLADAGLELYGLLRKKNIEEARKKVGWIVGRTTDNLDEGEITRATVETVAENTVDGITSPLFFYAIFGPLGAVFYRTANTMDSMLGYKNDRYLYFGRFAARFDDVLNYIPARLTFILLLGASFILGFDTKHAYRMGVRDAKKHPSPNGGFAEAPVAGALHIRLGGFNQYGDRMTFRAYMGEALEPLRGKHIRETIQLMYVTTLIAIACTTLVIYLRG